MLNKALRSAPRVLSGIRNYFHSYLTPGQSLVDRLGAETAREQKKAGELRKVLEAKKELARARAENIRLRKEIDGVNERTVGKENETLPVKPPRQKY